MLVLSRKRQEVICIGPNIFVTVLAMQGGKVRLGFDAPRDVPIVRAELQERGSFEETRTLPSSKSSADGG